MKKRWMISLITIVAALSSISSYAANESDSDSSFFSSRAQSVVGNASLNTKKHIMDVQHQFKHVNEHQYNSITLDDSHWANPVIHSHSS